jgi:hypothetical protein
MSTAIVNNPIAGQEDSVRFLNALFAPGDYLLLRPIESWTEQNRKQSKVDYRGTQYLLVGLKDQLGTWQPEPERFARAIGRQKERAEQTKANIFFGVSPRFGMTGRYDLAWQIRTVRVLWTDIDHVSVEEVRVRIAKARMPAPSAIVNSGNGAHVYWLLDSPCLIDDVGDPPPVETEWTELPGGRKRPRKYFVENGDKVYLDQRRHVSRLSPKAERFQDVLAGIAKAIGGDHTTDLSRLLRVPGTLNRKDQRNGRETPSGFCE